MDMYHPAGGDYRVANKVNVINAPHTIGWLTGQEKDGGRLEFGGWFWRYDLAPLGPAETEVTLGYDWSAVPESIRASHPVPAVRAGALDQLPASPGRTRHGDLPDSALTRKVVNDVLVSGPGSSRSDIIEEQAWR